jgi:hypothetical protein
MLSAQVHLGKISAVAVPSTSLRTGSTVVARPPYTPRAPCRCDSDRGITDTWLVDEPGSLSGSC